MANIILMIELVLGINVKQNQVEGYLVLFAN